MADRAKATTLREQAYGSFTQHLLARDLRAGQFISQRELVELTGLKLGAIRELIPRLETEGLVRTVPKRGMQIAHVDLKLIRDAFQFRQFLEVEAVALYAREAPEAELRQIRREHDAVIETCSKALTGEGITPELVDQAQQVDWAMHDRVIDALGNKIIADAYRVNSVKLRLVRQEQTRLNNSLVLSTMQEHILIIEALEARNPRRAREAMRKHINQAWARAVEQT